jgi:mannosylglycerate hydrolase
METLHLVSHTHWDREWYRTFQQFRVRLVHLLDRLLDLLEDDPDYRHFTLDGQTIVLDDYLAIRPEQEARIRRLVQDGRLLIGPWYILPDEFLEGPEALIRNLLLGRQGCRRFTAEPQPMERIGYIPDPFGHISQLPQIAAGFGMEALCFWRGVGDAPTEFRWAAPDGSERLVLHLRQSYSNGAWLAADEAGFVRDLATERARLAPHATTSHLLIMQGTDHMAPRADLPQRMRAAEAALDARVVHSTLPTYLAAVRAELGDDGLAALPLLRGEMRSPERAHLLPAVLSARMWIKQWNARCETLLTRWAEPFAALAEQLGSDTGQRDFLREAWSWLLQNHPHDSICGCSVDQVHREMQTRFAWCEQIAEEVTQASLEAIAGQVTSSKQQAASSLVFNPSAFPRTDRVRGRLKPAPGGEWHLVDDQGQVMPHRVLGQSVREHLDAPLAREALREWLARLETSDGRLLGDLRFQDLQVHVEGREARLAVTARYHQGAPHPGERLTAGLATVRALLADSQIQSFRVQVVEDEGLEVEFLARDVPSLGYRQFTVHKAQGTKASAQRAARSTQHVIENEFFRVEASEVDGTLTITDKANGLVLRDANRFVDGGDRGDEYTFCPPEHDRIVDAPIGPPLIRCIQDSIGATLEVALLYHLPCGLQEGDRSRRGHQRADVPITSRVTLTPGVRRIEFETSVDNQAEDHRLRVHFPTPIVAGSSWAEGHLDIVERPIALPTGTAGWAEQPVGAHPQRTFVDVSDGCRGVLLANRGLPEYEVLPGSEEAPGVTLALTLLRCVGWLSRGDLHNRAGHAGPALTTPEAQCPGPHTFHYALVPHAGNYLTAQREAHAFDTPLRAVPLPADGRLASSGSLPPGSAFVEVSPAALVVSALKPAETDRGLILRVYNSAGTDIQARIKLWQPFREIHLVSLDETGASRILATDQNALVLHLQAKEIATLRFVSTL